MCGCDITGFRGLCSRLRSEGKDGVTVFVIFEGVCECFGGGVTVVWVLGLVLGCFSVVRVSGWCVAVKVMC